MAEINGDCILNREGDILPYAFYNPQTEGKLTWMCGEDAEGKITAVFCFDHGTHKDKSSEYIESAEKAKWIRDELINSGWQKIKPLEVTFRFPGEKDPRKMNRKEKRVLARQVIKQNKHNPFNEEK